MAINKVVYGNDTLIDLTNDTVEASNLLEGETAHDRSGSPVTGTAKQGHIVQNSSGTDMTQRAKLQFLDAGVEDDSTNNKTKVSVVREMTRAEYDLLSADERKGIIHITDEPDIVIGEVVDDYVEVEGDGEKTWATLLSELYLKVDKTKIIYGITSFVYNANVYVLCGMSSSELIFTQPYVASNGTLDFEMRRLTENPSTCVAVENNGGTVTLKTNQKLSNGTKITLYYGTQSAPIELTTDAEHCLMSNGESVESVFTENVGGAEHIVGCLDGRNVYQRRVNVSLTAGTRATFDFPSGYIRYWVSNEDSFIASSTYGSLPINFSSVSHYIFAYMENNQLRIESDQWSGECWVNVRYIKS